MLTDDPAQLHPREQVAAGGVPGPGRWYTLTTDISGSYDTEAFAAPVHAPDFKSARSDRSSRNLVGYFHERCLHAECAPSARPVHRVAEG
jgi:hypothetical protein